MKNAIYFVVDENLAAFTSAQAYLLSQLGNFNIHVFIEGSSKSKVLSSPTPTRTLTSKKIHYHFNELSNFLPKNLPESKQWPWVVYLRLFVPQILSNYSRLLYLDADTAVFGDLKPLFELDLALPIGAVHDHGMLAKTEALRTGINLTTGVWPQGIGLEGSRYFNSGVLLINPAQWNLIKFEKQIPIYFEEYGHRVRAFDQDFLNYIFKNNWVELSPCWNFQTALFDLGFEHFFQPAIVHFTGPAKPWNNGFYALPTTYQKYFSKLYRFQEISLPKKSQSLRRRVLKTAKVQLRSALHRIGVQSKRSSQIWRQWETHYRKNKKFIQHAMQNNLYSDMSANKCIREPEVFFDGSKIRTKDLDKIYTTAKHTHHQHLD